MFHHLWQPLLSWMLSFLETYMVQISHQKAVPNKKHVVAMRAASCTSVWVESTIRLQRIAHCKRSPVKVCQFAVISLVYGCF